MVIASQRLLWAVGFVALLPAGLGMGILSLRSTSQMDGPERWTIASPWLLGIGVFVCMAALFSLGLYLVHLRKDRRTDTPASRATTVPTTADRWLWAASYIVLLPLGLGLCLGSFMPDQSAGLSTPTDWTIRYPARFAAGVIVLACALLALRGYLVRLKSDLRIRRERKAEPQ